MPYTVPLGRNTSRTVVVVFVSRMSTGLVLDGKGVPDPAGARESEHALGLIVIQVGDDHPERGIGADA